MLRNHLRTAYRSVIKNKSASFINVFGLALGTAACLLILQYIFHEMSFDDFHRNGKSLYRVILADPETEGRQITMPPLGKALRDDYPQVEAFARLHAVQGLVSHGDVRFKEPKMYWADASFLTMFSYPLVDGSPEAALTQPNTAVISRKTARKYFGAENPVGKMISVYDADEDGEGEKIYSITGVLKDVPANSHLQFDFLLSYKSLKGEKYEHEWEWRNFYTYVQLAPGTDPRTIEKQSANITKKYTESKKSIGLALQPVRDVHLAPGFGSDAETYGDVTRVVFLGVLALFILGIAWANYVNLATARAMERAKEVGIKKVLGAARGELIRQFMLEALLLNTIAAFIAVVLVRLLSSVMSQAAELPPSALLFSSYWFWIAFLGLFLAGVFVSGFYPAFVLSSFNPMVVLKGKVTTSARGIALRKGLVILQFAISVALIIGTFTIYRQLAYMRSRNLGMNMDGVLVIEAPVLMDQPAEGTAAPGQTEATDVFKTAMLNQPGVTAAAASDVVPGMNFLNFYKIRRPEQLVDDDKENATFYAALHVDYDFLSLYQIKLLAGRSFSRQYGSDREALVINRAAAKELGFHNPQDAVNQQVMMGKSTRTILGVVENYNHLSLQNHFGPVAFRLKFAQYPYYSLKVRADQVESTIAAARAEWNRNFPRNNFDYFFLSYFFDQQYRADQRFGSLFGLFAALAIAIACLGLFGLSSFSAAQRSKEIGIRKSLGATTGSVFLLLSKEFLKLIVIANVIAWPLMYLGMENWLSGFAYRIGMHWYLFLVPALALLFIALLTVSYQTIKAARIEPIQMLRHD